MRKRLIIRKMNYFFKHSIPEVISKTLTNINYIEYYKELLKNLPKVISIKRKWISILLLKLKEQMVTQVEVIVEQPELICMFVLIEANYQSILLSLMSYLTT